VAVSAAARRTAAELRLAAADARAGWPREGWLWIAGFALAAAFPLAAPSALRLDDLANGLYLATAAVGLALAAGLGGIPSLGQGAFVGIGAFAATLLRVKLGWPLVPAATAATAVGAAVGVVTGIGLARLRAPLVAVSTWLLTWLVVLVLQGFPSISGGTQGLVVPPAPIGIRGQYELALAVLALAMLLFAGVARGPAGLRLAALREQPAAAVALGTPAARLLLGAFTASAAIGALAGALAVQVAGVADPTAYGPSLSFKLLVAVLIGGALSAAGPPAGLLAVALISIAWSGVTSLESSVAGLHGAGNERLDAVITSIVLLSVLAYGGRGIMPWLSRWRRRVAGWERHGETRSLDLRAGARLSAEKLTRRYGSLAAVEDFTLELAPGTIVALVGPNGSGKTTVLRLLAGAERPDAGRIRLGERDLTTVPAHAHAEAGIVRTLQDSPSFGDMTALECVLTGAFLRRPDTGPLRVLAATPRARRALSVSRGDAYAALREVGLEHAAATPSSQLDTGDRRLVMLAGALACRPTALLLDEPATGLAAEQRERLVELLARQRTRGLQLLLVEHDLRVVRALADRIVVLEAGRVIADGAPQEVGVSEAVRAAYLGAQTLSAD
jgi:branched-chain amino acid transport system permease protein